MSESIVKDKEGAGNTAKISRRDFLDGIIRFGLFATLAGMILPALSYLKPVTRRGPAGGMSDVGSTADIPVGGAKKVILAGSAIMIIRTSKEFKAFSAVCTHLGCLVDWDEKRQQIICPCHGGQFDTEGRVISGPPPRPLPVHEVKIVGDRILVKV